MTQEKPEKLFENPYYHNEDFGITLVHGNCFDILPTLRKQPVNMIFADPPYFLSSGGITCRGGRMVSVDKGDWDKSLGVEENHQFNLKWLAMCRELLTANGTIWVSGTAHIIYSLGYAMQTLGYKILNDIIWHKGNPPPNLSCRYFTHATETLIWAARSYHSKHTFNYAAMKELNKGKQMQSLWRLSPSGQREKTHGKHPAQKPLALLERVMLASTQKGDVVLDPFNGSGTTGVAAVRHRRRYFGIEMNEEFLEISVKRIEETIAEQEACLFEL